ncbi:MAG: hypothetical protein IAF02_13870 [Anaerolineae bacterium]|nr:hypothetical protein [Anaerolineae bacterium]
MTIIDLSELKNMSLEEILYRVARQRKPLTIRLSAEETVTLQPGIESEDAYWQQLATLGLISHQRIAPSNETIYQPIHSSESVSDTILRERR